ncbi:hypothetical protein [Oceanobacillus luteolus]|uniref:Uncharacterized protein n=2 Tax=Oceanobacillus luteolus TaxID=1274358 RepID=A0ABW4HVJ7_9BACI|nr:hypothetical protein [Oceanobacillus luteolus]
MTIVIMQETLEMISNEEEQPDSQDAKEDLVISLTNTEKDTEKVDNTAEVEEQTKSIIETPEMEHVESKTKEVNQIEMEKVASVIHEDNSVEKKPLDSITNDIKPSEENPLEPNQQDSIIIEDSQDEVKAPLLIKEQHPVEVEKVESVHEEILNTSEAQLTNNEDGEKTFDLVIHQSDPNKVMEVDPETDVIDNRIQAQESKKGTNFEVLDWMENRLSDSYDEDIYIEEYLDFHGFGDNGAKNERDKVSKGRYRNWNGSSDEDYNNPSTRVLYIIQNWHQHS